VIERPNDRAHGDWSTNVALKFGKRLGYASPRAFAEALVAKLEGNCAFDALDIAGPGFINFTLNSAAAAAIVADVLTKGESYGLSDALAGESINLEFVSANPTGPLHIGGVRWAAVGDALARILISQGAKVEREYYFNDHGTQIDRFAASLYAAARGEDTPEDGYAGVYIAEIAAEVVKLAGGNAMEVSLEDFRRLGVEIMFPLIKQSLNDFGVHFDTYFHEQSLYDSGAVQKAIETLREKGEVYEQDGALWLATTKYGDDKDRVVIKSNGEEAYFAADIAYYLDKRQRASKAVYMLGADHGGYIGRLYALAQAFGDQVHTNIEIMIGQLVNLVKDGVPVRMSKRAGNIITIDDLVSAVGVDAARFALTRSNTDTPLELDIDLLASHKLENPVYYVQYAYARTRNVLRNYNAVASETFEDGKDLLASSVELGLLNTDSDEELFANLSIYPGVLSFAASELAPHKVTRYLEDLAASYHKWYATSRVVGEGISDELSKARLSLNLAVSEVLKSGLNMLGVSAPERM
jgi:arginyl-tRNA synthetase